MSQDITHVTPTQQVVYESTSYDSFDRLTYNRNYTPERGFSLRKYKKNQVLLLPGKIISGHCFTVRN